MTADELRTRLARVAAWPPDPGAEHGDDIRAALQRPLTPAAVLVPIVLGEMPGVLLTKRTSHLKAHAGQVSFPGGRIDPEDNGPEDAALREAWEEIGLHRQSVEILGRLADYATGTGYRITPILSILPPGLTYQPSEDEVEAVFELPMTVLLDPEAPRRQRQHVRGEWREYWVWPHPDHYIWGATAAILVHLAQRLRQGRP
ncbi:MAG: CoA pyrophosphatase [Proteobacteria bacterium]|nr:CoA pyrophosphatase [Pseudomonadota bacterium]